MPENMDDELAEFVGQSLELSFPGAKQLTLGPVPDAVVQYVLRENGIDLTDYTVTIDVYAVRHILKSHGNALKEEARGQRAVTAADGCNSKLRGLF
jgi:hypothetical protein